MVGDPEPFMVQEEACELEGWDVPGVGKVVWRTLLSGDRTPTSGLTVGIAEVAPSQAGDLFVHHRHAAPEVYYILAGQGIVTVAGVDYPVRPGATVFIPGNTWHGTRHAGSAGLRMLYAFAVDSFADVVYEFGVPAGDGEITPVLPHTTP